jgi:ankyrin repeat protein
MKHDDLLWASWKCDFKAIRRLLKAGGNPQVLLWTPLMLAIAVGTIDDVRRELQDEPDLYLEDCHHRTAWLLACAVGDVHKARLLREHGAELDIRSIEWAVRANHVNMLRWLLWLGLKPESSGGYESNALILASGWGATDCVRLLLKIGMDVNIEGDFGLKPINDAANADVARLLVNAGADIDNIDREGYSILLVALEKKDIGFVKALLEMGADPNKASISRTPLWYAAQNDDYEAVKLLLEAGANPNQKTEVDGWFPLEDAKSLAMVELLLEHGADPLMKNYAGKCASEIQTDPKIVRLLKQAEKKAAKKST